RRPSERQPPRARRASGVPRGARLLELNGRPSRMTIAVELHSRTSLLRMYTQLVRIRLFEDRTTELFNEGHVKGTAHSWVGQEAIAVGAAAALRENDYIAGHHRSHGHVIAKGADLRRMIAELLGREDGYCHGLGGSMHIADLSLGIIGCNGIVGAS